MARFSGCGTRFIRAHKRDCMRGHSGRNRESKGMEPRKWHNGRSMAQDPESKLI